MAAKIKTGDVVFIMAGKDKGQSGRVTKVFPQAERAVVEGRNLVKRHTRQSTANPQGGIIEKEASIHISNLMIRDPKTGQPTRVGFKTRADGTKIRIAKRSGVEIDV